jgi:hypothetical protein
MSNIYGEVVEDVCINIVVATQEWILTQPQTFILSTPDNVAWVGATVTDGVFSEMPHQHDHPDGE